LVPRLVLINGAPGSGKSTLAHLVAHDQPLTLALDVDALKHSLGSWDRDPTEAGLRARRLAIALARENLSHGSDVIVAQYLAQSTFIDQLDALARSLAADFVEIMLVVDPTTLAQRLAARGARPDRPEHHVNNRLVGPDDAGHLTAAIEAVLRQRPRARLVDASGDVARTAARVRAAIESHPEPL
jgi:predicted kinase